MIHSISNEIKNLVGSFSRESEPIIQIDSGDEIHAQTRCCWWGIGKPSRPEYMPEIIELAARKDPENDTGMPLVGPIGVKGATPGMTLEVEILELKVGDYGRSVTGGSPKERYEWLALDETRESMPWEFEFEEGLAYSPMGYAVKLRPFLGCMGVPIDAPGHHTNRAAYRGGGNMDCKELVAGSKLFLPIAVPGALFSFGDGHAAQGDGESGDSAIECPMEMVKLRLTLRKDMPIKWPMADTPSGWVTFGFHEELEKASFIALSGMLDVMVERLGVSRKEAAMLASLAVDLRVTQIVNPTVGVHAVWPHDALIKRLKR